MNRNINDILILDELILYIIIVIWIKYNNKIVMSI